MIVLAAATPVVAWLMATLIRIVLLVAVALILAVGLSLLGVPGAVLRAVLAAIGEACDESAERILSHSSSWPNVRFRD